MSACAYCGKARGIHTEHVVPKQLLKKIDRSTVPAELLETVMACPACNWFKLTRRLVPPSWEDRLPLLTETFPGTPWRIWDGDVASEAYRGTFV